MDTFDTFIIESFDLDPDAKVIRLRYALDETEIFEEQILLPEDRPLPSSVSPELQAALFALHIAGGVSYYKTSCPPTIEVRSGELTADMAAFWNEVYEKGLGEFFYKNDIDFRGLIRFPVTAEKKHAPAPVKRSGPRKALIPIGGGKDSMVTIELLCKTNADITLLRMGKHPFITRLVEETGLPLLTIERRLSPRLFSMNAEGALNGHVPITAYLSCLSVVLGLLYGFDTIPMSNERSADEGNVEYLGTEINHQWSKSIEFERAFRAYLSSNVTNAVEYFSLLRPVSELTIAKIFAELKQYRASITSCNANWKIAGEKPKERWCGHCPKCLFSFILFSAFLSRSELQEMFGGIFLDDETLAPLFQELLGTSGIKPFECVGTPEETIAALTLAQHRGDLNDTVLIKHFVNEVLVDVPDPDGAITQSLTLSEDHAVPGDLLPLLHAHQ